MTNTGLQYFNLRNRVLTFDAGKSILLCKDRQKQNKKIWVKKLNEINWISDVIEDSTRYFISGEWGESGGQYLALNKKSGATEWFIPGRSFLHILFGGYLYLIFIDEKENYFLLKVDRSAGRRIWYHQVEKDLKEYHFSSDSLVLSYGSGKQETINPKSGRILIPAK